MARQCRQFTPTYAVMADAAAAEKLQQALKQDCPDIKVLSGIEGLETVASLPEVEYVMAAIVGAAGLLPNLAAVRSGKRVLLANKESLVMSGDLFMAEVHRNNATLLPIDSEHNAIFQCMPDGFRAGDAAEGVRKVLLTASGGPFRDWPVGELASVTPQQACNHPNWDMGRKISIDSATMMNKGLEIIEACWLFNLKPSDIQVVIHKQSIIHSMVEYVDGSVLAQLGNPDMKTPIACSLAWPERIESGVNSLDLFEIARLDFEPADVARFPCLRLAMEAVRTGGTAPTVLNAANEIAVDAFLNNHILFTDIPKTIEMTLAEITVREANSIDVILEEDMKTRQMASGLIEKSRRRTAH
ncbi:MAG: 1-deoxy-D-xylulose-5-phosphate reductoisomerase [Gammaproteobacteria bacterium]|nr:MAG: 1-deoxy-D-xylulose-5-phosphate reductoisomerase [Gammaproteobacteria bacterium]